MDVFKNETPIAGEESVSNDGRIAETNRTNNYFDYREFKRRQNIAIGILSAIGAIIFILGLWQIRRALVVPLPAGSNEKNQIAAENQKAKAVDLSQEDSQKLKTQDTDGDGVKDFDELYVYNTSPYLADSDSDNDSDFDEIQNGDDPNCPKGQNCFQSGVTAALENEETVESEATLNVSANALRQILIQSGKISKEQIDKISDQDLLDLYSQMVKDNPELAKQLTQTSEETAEDAAPGSANLSAQELRKTLLGLGIDEKTVNSVSDADLLKLYQEALKQVENQ